MAPLALVFDAYGTLYDVHAVVARCEGFDAAHPILVDLQRRVTERLSKAIGLSVALTLVAPRTVPRSEGKAVRVVEKG